MTGDRPRLELAILIGLQGAGKSTFARERLAATHVVVAEVREGHDPVRNATVTAVRRRVVVDEALPVGAALARLVNGLA